MAERPKPTADELGVPKIETGEPVTNLITWVYEDGSYAPGAKFVNNERYSIVSDYLGRPVQAYDDVGQIVWQADYDIYGGLRNLRGEQEFIPFRQLGQYEDEETGLYYNRFRYYDPNTGIYISQDPIRLASGNSTLYNYTQNSAGLEHLGSYSDTPTYFFNDPYIPGSHERIHAAQKTYVGSRQEPWTGTPEELIAASKKGLVGLDDIRGDLKIPRTGEVLASNVIPLEAFEKLEEWHNEKMNEKIK